MLYGNPDLTGHERVMQSDELIVTKTDLTGRITYANQTFFKYAGFTEKESLGVQHNLIRHPHMPRCLFYLLWQELEQEREVFAFVNNRSKNGDNYWVLAHATPSYDANHKVVGYHSNRRAPKMEIIKEHIVPLYQQLLELEHSIESPKEAMAASFKAVVDLLASKKMTVNEFMFSLGI